MYTSAIVFRNNYEIYMGGFKMITITIYVLLFIGILLLNHFLAKNASDIAIDKGYDENRWYYICFFLGPIGYILIAAMPDRSLQKKQDKTNRLLETLIDALDKNTEKQNTANGYMNLLSEAVNKISEKQDTAIISTKDTNITPEKQIQSRRRSSI